MKKILLVLAAACTLVGQSTPPPQRTALLNNNQALELYTRSLQLIESTMIAVPELSRAGAPLLESARQSMASLRLNAGNSLLQYNLMNSVRAYLTLSDAVPKPYPFPEAGQKQFAELRESVERMDLHMRALMEQKDRQLRSSDPDNLARYAEVDARVGPPQPGKPRVVFLGDSITDSWRLNEYFPDRDFLNRGISGQTTGQMLGRMKADVIDLRPALMLVLAGTNDIARGIPLQTIEGNLTMIADLADHFKIKIILASVLPVSDYHKDVNPAYEMTRQRPPELIRALNSWIQSFCTQRNYTFLDYYSDTVDASGRIKADLADDGLHPNSNGYRIMAPLALAAINKTAVVTAAPPAPPKKRRFFSN
jgi:lysophospholipase L1-like esterase